MSFTLVMGMENTFIEFSSERIKQLYNESDHFFGSKTTQIAEYLKKNMNQLNEDEKRNYLEVYNMCEAERLKKIIKQD
jgi:predicted solute-binding protein